MLWRQLLMIEPRLPRIRWLTFNEKSKNCSLMLRRIGPPQIGLLSWKLNFKRRWLEVGRCLLKARTWSRKNWSSAFLLRTSPGLTISSLRWRRTKMSRRRGRIETIPLLSFCWWCNRDKWKYDKSSGGGDWRSPSCHVKIYLIKNVSFIFFSFLPSVMISTQPKNNSLNSRLINKWLKYISTKLTTKHLRHGLNKLIKIWDFTFKTY